MNETHQDKALLTVPLRYVSELSPQVDFSIIKDEDEVTFLPMDRIKRGFFIPNSSRFSSFSPSYNAFENGDILLAKVTPCFENGNIAIAENLTGGKGFGTSEIFVIRPTDMDARFLFYSLQSATFKKDSEASMTGAGGLKRVSPDAIRRHRIPLLTLETQHTIANYLDRETARIDTLVAEKEAMLKLLKEKRAALISQAVTRGLNPNAPLKPSGLDWLGDIPEHWKVERAKNLFQIRDERSETGEEELLTVSHITGVTRRSDKEVYMFQAEDKTGYKLVSKGDFITNTLWAWMGAMGIAPIHGIVSPDYHVYTSKGQIHTDFMELLCRSKPFVAEVIRWSKGVWSSRLRLYPENFFEIRFAVPPHDEQQAIVAEIEAERQKTTVLTDALRKSITLLQERRSALITAAVTGQISKEEMTA